MPGPPEPRLPLVLSCEHGGNRVPARWRRLFRGAEDVLESHRGWDPGALRLARGLARSLGAPLVATTVTRLLVEPNRSLGHPQLLSEFSGGLPEAERRALVARYWAPHRERVAAAVRETLEARGWVCHLGVHSFTPVLNGQVREVDVGVLYDPAREGERRFCRAWIRALQAALPELRVRANSPYQGAADGLTTTLRATLPEGYLGVELEVGQALLARGPRERARLTGVLARTLRALLASEEPQAPEGLVRRGRARAGRYAPGRAEAATAPDSCAAGEGKRSTPTSGW